MFSCAKDDSAETVKVTPPIVVSGFKDFKNVIIGVPVKSKITLTNSSSNLQVVTTSGSTHYTLSSLDPSCAVAVQPSYTCIYDLTVLASSPGVQSFTVSFRGDSASFTANAIAAGFLVSSETLINVGSLLAGESYNFSTDLSNTGDLKTSFPTISGSSGLSVVGHNCGTYLEAGEICTLNMTYRSTVKNPSFSTLITMYTGDNTATFTIAGTILAGEMVGNIGFTTSPVSIHAGGVSNYNVVTGVITDQYGNAIEDGTPLTLTFFNLTDVFGGVGPVTLFSSGGRYNFDFKTTNSTGAATLSLNSLTSSGNLNWTVQP